MKDSSKKEDPGANSQVRFSSVFLAAERRKNRRGVFWGAIFGLVASAISLTEGVRAWSRHELVDMGVRFSYAKYPPSAVIVGGLIGMAACGYCLWWLWRDRSS